MRWSKFILLTERGKLVTLATWKVMVIMTCSTTADARAPPSFLYWSKCVTCMQQVWANASIRCHIVYIQYYSHRAYFAKNTFTYYLFQYSQVFNFTITWNVYSLQTVWSVDPDRHCLYKRHLEVNISIAHIHSHCEGIYISKWIYIHYFGKIAMYCEEFV